MNTNTSIRSNEHCIRAAKYFSGSDEHFGGSDEHAIGFGKHAVGSDEHFGGFGKHSDGSARHAGGSDEHSGGTQKLYYSHNLRKKSFLMSRQDAKNPDNYREQNTFAALRLCEKTSYCVNPNSLQNVK